MSEAKYTPGPWFWHEPINPNRRDFGVTAVRQYNPSKGAVRRIAWVGNASNAIASNHDEVRANARLIAASPTLYAYVARKASEGDVEATKIVESIHAPS